MLTKNTLFSCLGSQQNVSQSHGAIRKGSN